MGIESVFLTVPNLFGAKLCSLGIIFVNTIRREFFWVDFEDLYQSYVTSMCLSLPFYLFLVAFKWKQKIIKVHVHKD